MSIRCIEWAFKQSCGSSTGKLILIKLADNANDEGICWPSIEYMEKHCELSRSAIKENIRKLAGAGLLKIQERFKYGVQLPHLYHLEIPNEINRSPKDLPGRQEAGGRSPGDRGVGRQVTTEPSYKPPLNLGEDQPTKVVQGKKKRLTALEQMNQWIEEVGKGEENEH